MNLRGIVIKSEPIERILSGRKTWEIRSRRTNVREHIALIESGSGTIVGTCEVVDCLGPLTSAELLKNAAKMGVTRKEVLSWDPSDRDEFAWVLSDVRRLPKAVPYTHPQGAVIWVTLDSKLRRRIGL